MRLSAFLRRQHIDYHFKKHWLVQGKRVPVDTGVEDHLKSLGIAPIDAMEFIKEKEEHPKVKVIDMYEQPPVRDNTHPDYKQRVCYTLKLNSMLVEGIDQAQVITKTVISEGSLPDRVEELSQIHIPDSIHECAKKIILSANVFDAEQKKLPKIKDPVRPAFNFTRILGITDARRNVILTNKMLQLVERSSDFEASATKHVSNDLDSSVIFEKDSDLIQFLERSNILVSSKQPLKYDVTKKEVKDIPDIYPLKHTVTLSKEHFYDSESSFPIKSTVPKKHPHTTWLHFNRTQVYNEFETPATRQQELGRALTHTFTVAAAYAKNLYGEDAKELPQPVHLNCVQTDGECFHLGVLELNTLDLNGSDGIKNVWHTLPDLKLYGRCQYVGAIPVLENYNPKYPRNIITLEEIDIILHLTPKSTSTTLDSEITSSTLIID